MKYTITALLVLWGAGACTPGSHFKNSDEQAWMEYQTEIHSQRAPASVAKDAVPADLEAIANSISARAILLSCQSGENMQACYESKVAIAFDDAFRKAQKQNSNLNPTVYKSLQKSYLAQHSFDETFSEVQSFHQRLFSGMDALALQHAKEMNETCAGETSANAPVHAYFPFNGGLSDMPKGQLNCLNEKWFNEMTALLNETSKKLDLEIKEDATKSWIQKYQIQPVFMAETLNFLKAIQETEQKKWNEKVVPELKFTPGADREKWVSENAKQFRKDYPHLALEGMLTAMTGDSTVQKASP
jgi:hypothetical protein